MKTNFFLRLLLISCTVVAVYTVILPAATAETVYYRYKNNGDSAKTNQNSQYTHDQKLWALSTCAMIAEINNDEQGIIGGVSRLNGQYKKLPGHTCRFLEGTQSSGSFQMVESYRSWW